MTSQLRTGQNGSILVMVLILALAFSVVGMALSSYVISQQRLTYDNVYRANAVLVAEAGIERSVRALNISDNFAGYSATDTDATLFDNAQQGRGVFVTTVENAPSGNAKIITSTGKVYRHGDTTKPVGTSIVKVTVVGTQSSGASVATGPGGLILGGSASIANSNVSVSGTITMTGNSHIGTDSTPVTVNVGNIACPKVSGSGLPGPTYPALCTTSQPISIPDWSGSSIIGTVCAAGQTQSKFPDSPNNHSLPQIRAGSTDGLGLVTPCTPPAVTQPTYDRAGVIAGITTTSNTSTNPYKCNGSDTVTYPANMKLTDSTVTWGGSCTFVISGNMYIPGNLSVGGSAKIKVANSVGTTRPIVVVDGTINVGGSAAMFANSSGAGIDFVSFKNRTGDPAATPTGDNLYLSQKDQNITIGGSANLPGMVFDAYWSKISLGGSGNMGAAAGQTVDLSGAGTVVFGTILSSGTQTWSITSYQRLFPN